MKIERESIFLSCVRYLFNSFFSVIGIIIALVLILAGGAMFMGPNLSKGYKSEVFILPDEHGNDTLLPETAPAILNINIEGVIGTFRLNSDTVKRILQESRKGMFKKDRIKGIMLHFNTPGGTASDSDTIYRNLVTYKKEHKTPVYSYIDAMCASGGVYIDCASDKTYSSPVAIIGSVGVKMGPFFNFHQIMDNYGIKALTLTKGLDKDMFNPYRKWDETEDKPLQNLIDHQYKRFVDIVVSNKPNMNQNKLVNEYGAHVFDPDQAQEYGYIDEAGASYNKALSELARASGIEEDQKYQVVQIDIRPSLLMELMESKNKLLNGFKNMFENPLNLRNPEQNRILYHCDL